MASTCVAASEEGHHYFLDRNRFSITSLVFCINTFEKMASNPNIPATTAATTTAATTTVATAATASAAAAAAQAPSLERLEINNFKRFPSLDVNLKAPSLLITGPNGCGKTQLLWAILLFFRAYNSRIDEEDKKRKKFPIHPEIHELLCPSLHGLNTFISFVNTTEEDADGEPCGKVRFTGTFSNEKVFTALLHSNGVLEFRDLPDMKGEEKIRFASISSSYRIKSPTAQTATKALIAHHDNIRYLYNALGDERKAFVGKSLTQLFRITELTVQEKSGQHLVLVHDASGVSLEIVHHGTAFQKVFATLVYLSTLSQQPESRKYLLVDELECHLYPAVVTEFLDTLTTKATEWNVKLIITSMSADVIKPFPQQNLLCLSAENPGYSG
jgi:energy-coupling factor transporter ATP-binding protein EcfA2